MQQCPHTRRTSAPQIIVVFLPLWEARDVFWALIGKDKRPIAGPEDDMHMPGPKSPYWDDSAHGIVAPGINDDVKVKGALV